MNIRRTCRSVAAIGVVGLALAGYGCEGVKHMVTSFTPTKTAVDVEPRVYPADAPLSTPLDIEVTRLDRKQIRLDNRTPRPYENVTLWLNGQYGTDLESLPIGRSHVISLATFVNQHGETFPTGSILEPEKTQIVVLGDLQVGQQLHKLVVRLPANWEQPRGGVSAE